LKEFGAVAEPAMAEDVPCVADSHGEERRGVGWRRTLRLTIVGRGVGRGEAPHSGVKLEVLPEADKPRLGNLLTLSRVEIPVLLGEVVVGAVPVRSWLWPSGDEGRTREDRGVTGKGGVVVRLKAAGVAEENPKAGGRKGSLVRRGGRWGGRNIGVWPLKDGEGGAWSVDGDPRGSWS
jgi:hypothetical protein